MAIVARKPLNPFYLITDIPDEYFCDRENETKTVIGLLENGNNVVITAPRRVGKTSMLHHILNNSGIKKKYNTLYVDIYDTKTPEDFISEFRKAIQKSDFSGKDKDGIEKICREFYAKIDLSGIRIPLSAEAGYKEERVKKAETTIDSIFDFLEKTKKPNIIVFDEFQQIEEYSDKITRLLRSKIQWTKNTGFIYSGSETHLLTSMFSNYNEPFYGSSSLIGLSKIKEPVYAEFCQRMFAKYGKTIDADIISEPYNLFWGSILNLQQLFNKVFEQTPSKGTVKNNDIIDSINLILDARDEAYKATLRDLKDKERQLLEAIAIEGVVSGPMSGEFVRKYQLGTPSSIQNSLKNLHVGSRPMISKSPNNACVVRDKFLELWIAREHEMLQWKISNAKENYERYKKTFQRLNEIKP